LDSTFLVKRFKTASSNSGGIRLGPQLSSHPFDTPWGRPYQAQRVFQNSLSILNRALFQLNLERQSGMVVGIFQRELRLFDPNRSPRFGSPHQCGVFFEGNPKLA